jgi:phosphate uptake regulator
MKVSTSLERIADQSVTIARRAKRLNARPAKRELAFLEPPYRLAVAIFRDSIRAFADGDYELARTLKLKDRELDALTDDVIERLVERAAHESESVPSYLDLIFGIHSSVGSCALFAKHFNQTGGVPAGTSDVIAGFCAPDSSPGSN